MILWLCISLVVVFALRRLAIYVAIRRDYEHLPHITCLISPLSILGATLPATWWNLGVSFIYRDRKTLYSKTNNDIFVVAPILCGPIHIYTSSFHAFKQILSVGGSWVKPERAMKDLSMLGPNVVASEGDVWKRHRRVTAPAFNQSAYENVWNVAAGVYAQICNKEGWNGSNAVDVRDMNKLTHQVALFVIAICGFGLPMSWGAPGRDEQGKMSIEKMILEVATSIFARARLPSLAYKIGNEKMNTIDEAYNSFERLMHEIILEREVEIEKLRAVNGGDTDIGEFFKDVLGRLVGARMGEGKLSLTDEEVISNCFIMMFAGHETTANTLAATLALLGCHQVEQENIYQSIRKVLGDRQPTFSDYDALDDVLACFYEALRLFPAAYVMLRIATDDTTLMVPRKDDPSKVDSIPLKKGTEVVLDCVGSSYDPKIFPEPETFRPSRWTKTSSDSVEKHKLATTGEAPEPVSASSASSLDGFIGFSFGPRTCLGHKFAKVEAVCFLTNLLREWKVEVVLREGETIEGWKERILTPQFGVTLTLGQVPVRLVRRN